MISSELFEYAVRIRRQIHSHPELGFDTEETVKLITKELEGLGIKYTLAYGRGSVVCELGQGERTIALRADMDALPIEEKTGLEYSSRIPGRMHACGHDAHTAILLAVARLLKENEAKLRCRVRLLFQPSEECAESGAKMMVDNGVLDGVDHILCTHCEATLDSGKLGVCYGDYMAACVPLSISFRGRSSHAAIPESGIDAIAMANEAYAKMKAAVAEEAREEKYIWSVGRFSGGTAHNVIAALCEMDISFRFYKADFAKRVEARVKSICREVAEKYGGSCEVSWNISAAVVHNDVELTGRFEKIARESGIEVQEVPKKMSSEDFGCYLEKVPGLIFRFGTRNKALGCTAMAHRSDFCIDEAGMIPAIRAFYEYVISL